MDHQAYGISHRYSYDHRSYLDELHRELYRPHWKHWRYGIRIELVIIPILRIRGSGYFLNI